MWGHSPHTTLSPLVGGFKGKGVFPAASVAPAPSRSRLVTSRPHFRPSSKSPAAMMLWNRRKEGQPPSAAAPAPVRAMRDVRCQPPQPLSPPPSLLIPRERRRARRAARRCRGQRRGGGHPPSHRQAEQLWLDGPQRPRGAAPRARVRPLHGGFPHQSLLHAHRMQIRQHRRVRPPARRCVGAAGGLGGEEASLHGPARPWPIPSMQCPERRS